MTTDMLDIENHEQLAAYLNRRGHFCRAGDCVTLAGGVSNKTVLVNFATGASWVFKQALAKLRVKDEWLSDPSRIQREAEALRWLPSLAPAGAITPLIFEDREHNLLAMEAVPQPHENYKTLLLHHDVDAHRARALVQQFGTLLGTIHARSSARPDVAAAFEDRSFFVSLRLEPYYLSTAKRVPRAALFLQELIDRTLAIRQTLVHGDYSPKNVLVRCDAAGGESIMLLDHEVIHFGDGAFDVGFALTHLLSKAAHLHPRTHDDGLAAVAFWLAYRQQVERLPSFPGLPERVIAHTLACLLARVHGKSPLEYLSESQRSRQSGVALELIDDSPSTVEGMIETFLHRMVNA